ncbi:ABC transporter permease [Conexibacter sp. SYSU D00693]|uniref:ABC transporter permease n=1 Tax=Conexibacter sp. SYSU D00693 TaxID=2812560 RepID=UPI00196AA96C|nr:ABC transporter permease [Conexibacter sp. SYSU D00693]
MRAFWYGAAATVTRDAKLFVSYRLRFVSIVLTSIFSLTLFYYVSRLVGSQAFESPDAYYAFVVVGLVILTVLNSTLGTPAMALRQELVAGTFERLYHSPLGALSASVSALLFPFVQSMITAGVMLGFSAIAFGMDLRWETIALAVPLGALGALAFLPFGIVLLAAVLLFKQAAAGTTWVVALISLVSGLYVPLRYLPEWMQTLSDLQPFTPAVDLLRNVIVGTALRHSVWEDLGKLAGFAILALPLSLWLLRAAIGRARKTGTITEY